MKKTILFIIISIFLCGCSAEKNIIFTAPPDDMPLQEAIKINLKTLDLDKLAKKNISELDGVNINKHAAGYELDYRYPNKPVKIKIIKFERNESLQDFWGEWLATNDIKPIENKDFIKFKYYEDKNKSYSVYAWQKGQWFTYIGVPNEFPESEFLGDRVQEMITNHYMNLAKKN